MADSTNTVAVKVLEDLGLRSSFTFATETMGLRGLVEELEINGTEFTDLSYGALGLGGLTRGVTMTSLTQAYAAFANEGTFRTARTYTQVLDRDQQVILDNGQEQYAAVSEKTAWYLTDMMRYTVERGTGIDARLDHMSVAGKTGTTSNDQDRWFAGYTPYYTAVTWVGYDEPEEIVLTESEANPASELWRKVMSKIHQDLPDIGFDKPSTVVTCRICADSGMLAGDWCERDLRGSRVITAQLALEDMPTQVCTCHVGVDFCGDKVAQPWCQEYDDAIITRYGMLDLLRTMVVDGVVVEDQQYTVPGRDDEIPAGYFRAETGVETPRNALCDVHSEPEEPPAPEELPGSSDHDPTQDSSPRTDEDRMSFWDWLHGIFGLA